MKSSKSKSAAKPVATSQPPSASVPDPTLKEPVSRTNKIYYDLQFPIKARGDLDTMAIQCLTKFLTTIYQVDETAVLLPYKSFYALNKEVLYKPGKLGQSYTTISKYFQGFCSQCLMKMMYVCILVGYNSPQEDFYKSLQPNMENFSHSIYTQSIQAPFISKIGWLFHLHKHTDLHCLTELLECLLHWINPNDPPIALGFQFKNIWDGSKTPKAIPPLATGLPNIPPLLSNPNAKS